MRPRTTLGIILVLVVLSMLFNLPYSGKFSIPKTQISFSLPSTKYSIKSGLDLSGGVEMTLQTDMSKIPESQRDDALESARTVIEKRVNAYGVSETVVQSAKVGGDRRILVDLPGVKDASGAANLVGKTAQLSFREQPATYSAQEQGLIKQGLPEVYLFKETGLTGSDLKSASVTYNQTSQGVNTNPQVAIQFGDEGAKKFDDITKRNVGKPLAIFLDENPVSAPTVSQEIIGGNAVITGQFTPDQAKQLAIQLNAGALPVPIKILSQNLVSATLGADSINKSLIAGIIGLSIVLLFMVSYYGWLGLLADAALIIYSLFVLTIFKTGLFLLPPVTLTLPGIAGFILSIGMAVDANILIFERMKEERRWGRSGAQAIELGFKRAWSSIRDSNISSLITAGILYYFGTGLVKGFAITLAIGVLVSMFTAVVVTKTLLRVFRK